MTQLMLIVALPTLVAITAIAAVVVRARARAQVVPAPLRTFPPARPIARTPDED
ncbi:MAG TPA: hypothetical protein VF897_20100 [Roseiflexaceae bacterium]